MIVVTGDDGRDALRVDKGDDLLRNMNRDVYV